jgi:hypothetical protein
MPLFRLGLIFAEFIRAAIQASLRLWCQEGALEVVTFSRSRTKRVRARRAYGYTPPFSTHALPPACQPMQSLNLPATLSACDRSRS